MPFWGGSRRGSLDLMHLKGHGTALCTKLPPTLDPSHPQWECRSLMPTQVPNCARLQFTLLAQTAFWPSELLHPETEGSQSTAHERLCQQKKARNIQTSNDHVCLTS